LSEAFDPARDIVYSGSFNPLHYGHEEIGRAAGLITGRRVVYELTARNAEKATISVAELSSRVLQFRGRAPVLLSDEPRFIEKARQYGADFIIGADTAHRLFDERFLKRGETVSGILAEFRMLKTCFWVAPRLDDGGVLRRMEDVVPEKYRDLFRELPGRWDVSSTAIRNANSQT
jgi:hypothetical protein